jgi:hypothetical protein
MRTSDKNEIDAPTVRDVLLERKGLVFLPRESEWTKDVPRETVTENHLRAVDLSLAEIGYVLSTRLRAQLGALPLFDLALVREHFIERLAKATGAREKHVPLFRKFPDDVPADTTELWWKKFLARFFQTERMPCLFCRRSGTTHVLNPCAHVVCDHCWDGANYSACPVCERAVDRSSPFFLPSPTDGAPLPRARAKYKLLDTGIDLDADARALFVSFCERQQAMSPVDASALTTIVAEYGARIVPALPAKIPVKENGALVFGTLLQKIPADEILPLAKKYVKTATDVLRMVAALSGADPSLQGTPAYAQVPRTQRGGRWEKEVARLLATTYKRYPKMETVWVPYTKKRFRVARLSRAFRRALLSILESFDEERLCEDMLRHRSYWVWLGEHLHPHEYATRFPKTARAFAIVRENAPDGTPAPPFHTFASKVESALSARDVDTAVTLLRERPGDLARRFDHLVRLAAGDAANAHDAHDARASHEEGNARTLARVTDAFVSAARAFSTPVLLTLGSTLPTRVEKAPVRMYWPKGAVSKGVAATDTRTTLPPDVTRDAAAAIERELLRRFGEKPSFADFIVDDALATITVPFNERTASPSAVQLTRGSRVAGDALDGNDKDRLVRLFLHWCEPKGGYDTDIDLSVAFYDESWKYVGVCSYYQLECTLRGKSIAKSSGDRQNAPFPDGATEFVDLHRAHARAAGIRFAVMVVNAYAGMTFDQLERGYAGIMMRDDEHGAHFDPRTVTLKFALQGDNGVYMPLVFDVNDGTIHWLDVYSTGQLQFNNVATSSSDVARICPAMMKYFASGVRPTMRDLGLIHAAARATRVHLRAPNGRHRTFVRSTGETATTFLARIKNGEGASGEHALPTAAGDAPVFAVLHRGDAELPAKSVCYALFRESLTGVIAASELVTG